VLLYATFLPQRSEKQEALGSGTLAGFLTRRTFGGLALGLAASRFPAFAAEPSLVEAAKKEGRIVWYTTLVVGQIVRPIIAAFEAKYPGIKVDFVPAPWQETSLRIINEGRANQMKGDLVDGGASFPPLQAAGLIEPYLVQSAASYPKEFRDPTGLWTANIVQPSTPSVNLDQVKKSEIPQSYEDLLHPRWKGRMAWPDSPSVAGPPGFIGNVLNTMGQDRGMEYLEKLASQKIANIPSNQRVVLDQNIAGQYPLVLMIYNYHAAISMADGAPIEWLKLSPTLVSFGQMSLLKNGPNPNAAKLFLEFSLSEEGQSVYAAAGYLPAHPNVPSKAKGLKPDDGQYKDFVCSALDYSAHDKEWQAIYKKLFL
jgi:iron(III) transport system substrate-binding protein